MSLLEITTFLASDVARFNSGMCDLWQVNLPEPQSLHLVSTSKGSNLGSAIDQLCKAGLVPWVK